MSKEDEKVREAARQLREAIERIKKDEKRVGQKRKNEIK